MTIYVMTIAAAARVIRTIEVPVMEIAPTEIVRATIDRAMTVTSARMPISRGMGTVPETATGLSSSVDSMNSAIKKEGSSPASATQSSVRLSRMLGRGSMIFAGSGEILKRRPG